MKRTQKFIFGVCTAMLFFLPNVGFSQSSTITISAEGDYNYDVHLQITPTTVQTEDESCSEGYNYEVTLDYKVTFSGTDAPASLWTLQGYLDCVDDTAMFFDLPNSGGTGTSTTGANPWRDEADCETATPFSLNCSSMRILLAGPGIPERSVAYNPTPLPVELIFFYGTKSDGRVELNWATASEKNNNYFAIERSIDGKHWETIGSVDGNGTTLVGNSYHYIDPTPLMGISYYRLKQNDFDGSTSYSNIIVIKNTSSLETVKVYPNPARDVLFVEGVTLNMNDIQMVDITGKSVLQQVKVSTLNNKNTQIELSHLPSGFYWVRMGNQTVKVIKQ